MTIAHRPRCSTNLSLEVFGDKWSVLILGGPKVTDLRLSCGELPEAVRAHRRRGQTISNPTRHRDSPRFLNQQSTRIPLRLQHVHRRATHELGNEHIRGILVHVIRSTDLLELARAHHGNPIVELQLRSMAIERNILNCGRGDGWNTLCENRVPEMVDLEWLRRLPLDELDRGRRIRYSD